MSRKPIVKNARSAAECALANEILRAAQFYAAKLGLDEITVCETLFHLGCGSYAHTVDGATWPECRATLIDELPDLLDAYRAETLAKMTVAGHG